MNRNNFEEPFKNAEKADEIDKEIMHLQELISEEEENRMRDKRAREALGYSFGAHVDTTLSELKQRLNELKKRRDH